LLVESYTYEPFGKPTTSGTNASAFQFTGRENDGTGLYYYRARYYSPVDQRFIAQDPLDFDASGPEPYTYARNDPLDFRDPGGTQAIPIAAVSICVIAPEACAFAAAAGLGGAIGLGLGGLEDLWNHCAQSNSPGKWTCKAKCADIDIASDSAVGWVYGSGSGSTETEACNNAKSAAAKSTGQGHRTKHCRCFDCKKL
jgi:RHS repeat-associated protein